MQSESQVIVEWVQARTRRLRLLAADLVECRPAFVQLDLDAIYRHNQQQQSLCQEIQRLDAQVLHLVGPGTTPSGKRMLSLERIASGWDDETQENVRSLLEEHEAARQQVCDLSRIQTDLLRRSRRYLRVLSNLVCNSMGFYEVPGYHTDFPGELRGI